jgi:thiol-disulfide isomerase/thioredoxin
VILFSHLFQTLNINHTKAFLKQQVELRAINSLGAFSGLLDTYHIANVAVRLHQPQQLSQATFPCVAHCQKEGSSEAYFVVINNLKEGVVEYYDGQKTQQTNIENFAKSWSGHLLLLSPDEHSGEPNYAANRKAERVEVLQSVLGYVGLVALAVWLLVQASGWQSAVWLLCQYLGLGLCTLLLINTFGQPSAFVHKLCHLGKQTNCGAVLGSSAARLFGWLSWSEVGFMFFLSNILGCMLFGIESVMGFNVWLVPLWVVGGLASVYYQWRVAKAWCTLCLGVLAVLWIGALVGSPYIYGLQFQIYNFLSPIFYLPMLLAVGLWFLVRPFVIAHQQYKTTTQALGQWQHNSEVFKALLAQQAPVSIEPLAHEDQIGATDAPVIVTMVSNPNCGPCKTAYKELTDWQRYFCDEMQLRIRHIYSGEERYQSHDDWAAQVNIEYTPTIYINGRQIIEPYSFKDIGPHIRALAES